MSVLFRTPLMRQAISRSTSFSAATQIRPHSAKYTNYPLQKQRFASVFTSPTYCRSFSSVSSSPSSSSSSFPNESGSAFVESDSTSNSTSDASAENSPAAQTFRDFVRTRSASLAAKSKRELSSGKREWRDNAPMAAIKQESAGGVIRRTTSRVKEGMMDGFLMWAEENLHQAYTHKGFKGSYLIVDREKSTVENITLWSSELAVSQNANLPLYRSTMQTLAQFIDGVPELELKQVTLEIKPPPQQ